MVFICLVFMLFYGEVFSFTWFYNFQSKCALHEVKLDWVSNLEIFTLII